MTGESMHALKLRLGVGELERKIPDSEGSYQHPDIRVENETLT